MFLTICYILNWGREVVLSLFSGAFPVCWKFDNQIKQSSRKTTRIHMPKINPLSLTLPVHFSFRIPCDCWEVLGTAFGGVA